MICSNCGNPLSEGAKFCTNCGQKAVPPVLPVQEAPDEAAKGAAETEAPRCAYCGERLEEGLRFCTSCGRPASPAGRQAASAEAAQSSFEARYGAPKKKKRGGRVLLIVALAACVLLVLGFGGGYLVLRGYHSDAMALLNGMDFAAAKEKLLKIPGAEERYPEAFDLIDAGLLMDEGKLDKAIKAFTKLGDYENAETCLMEANYRKAGLLMEERKYHSAIALYDSIAEYKDAESLADGYRAEGYLTYVPLSDELLLLLDNNDNAELFDQARNEIGTISGDIQRYLRARLDGTVMLMTLLNEDESYQLYRIDQKAITELADGTIGKVATSAHGDVFCYTTEYALAGAAGIGTGKLQKQQGTAAAETIDTGVTQYFTVSPDGGTIAYVKYVDDTFTLLINNNGATEEIGEDLFPIGVSDGGEYLYYGTELDAGYEVFLRKNGETTSLGTIDGMPDWALFNEGMQEFMYAVGGATYLSVDGGSFRCIFEEGAISPTLCNKSASMQNYNGLATTYLYGMKTLANRIWDGAGCIVYVDAEFDTVEIGADVTVGVLSTAFNTLCYSDGSMIYTHQFQLGEAPDMEKMQTVEHSGVEVMRVSDDGTTVAFVDAAGTLYLLDVANGTTTEIADDVWRSFFVPGTTTLYYIANDDSLCLVENGQSKLLHSNCRGFFYNFDTVYVRLGTATAFVYDIAALDGETLIPIGENIAYVY